MTEEEQRLATQRELLNQVLIPDLDNTASSLLTDQRLIANWWTAYKNWEAKDDFNTAFQDNRMTVRTFGEEGSVPQSFSENDSGLQKGFQKQRNASFKNLDALPEQFWRNSQHSRSFLPSQEEINSVKENATHYRAVRGIDTAAFANPGNFVDRWTKYKEGLHDLSASLLDSERGGILTQVFHKSTRGTHWAFVPLSQEADQEVLYNLTRLAKPTKTTSNPALYNLIRTYRSEMTRVKLAHDQDMGVGFSYIPLATPINVYKAKRPSAFDKDITLRFKTHYSLAKTHKDRDTGKIGIKTTSEYFLARQKSAREFKSILKTTSIQNEIVIALRKHAGPFPVNAIRWENELLCYDIEGGKFKLNGKTISMLGAMS